MSVGDDMRAIGRNAAAVAGSALLVAGTVALVVAADIVLTTLRPLLNGRGPRPVSGGEALALTVSLVASVVAPVVGARLVGFRRRIALFLRRFGRVDATRALSHAVEHSLGRSWRLVSLDDAGLAPVAIEPLGIRGRDKRLVSVASTVWLVVACLAIWWFGFRTPAEADESSGEVRTLAEAVLNWAVPGDGLDGGTQLLRVAVVFLGLLGTIGLATGLLRRLLSPLGRLQKDRTAAEEAKRVTIEDEGGIGRATRRMVRRSRRFFSPQLFVVRVPGTIWQQAVGRFAGVAGAVIVDVSEASENLLWEIETLRPSARAPWIFVGRVDQVAALQTPTSPLQERLRDHLAGEPVLLYGDSPADLDRFAAELQRAIG